LRAGCEGSQTHFVAAGGLQYGRRTTAFGSCLDMKCIAAEPRDVSARQGVWVAPGGGSRDGRPFETRTPNLESSQNAAMRCALILLHGLIRVSCLAASSVERVRVLSVLSAHRPSRSNCVASREHRKETQRKRVVQSVILYRTKDPTLNGHFALAKEPIYIFGTEEESIMEPCCHTPATGVVTEMENGRAEGEGQTEGQNGHEVCKIDGVEREDKRKHGALLRCACDGDGDDEMMVDGPSSISTIKTANEHEMPNKTNFVARPMTEYAPKHLVRIGIVGGGLGGLSAALALQNAGFYNIQVYERDLCFDQRRDGYGLTLTYNPHAQGPLAKLGILEELALRDVPSRSHFVFSPEGFVRGYYGNAFKGRQQERPNKGGMGQRRNLRVPRQQVRQAMLDKLCDKQVTFQWGKRLQTFVDHEHEAASLLSNKNGHQPGGTTNVELNGGRNINHENRNSGVTVYFEDGTQDHVDLLVGADGVRSKVASLLYADAPGNHDNNKSSGNNANKNMSDNNDDDDDDDPSTKPKAQPFSEAQYIGIFIILGITSDFRDPFLDEQGFYTLDGTHRLFTMPFSGSRMDDLMAAESDEEDEGNGTGNGEHNNKSTTTVTANKETNSDTNSSGSVPVPRQIMWQLSFRLDDMAEVERLKQASRQQLLEEVLERCNDWHAPVQDMMRCTPLKSIWGTGLMDRVHVSPINSSLHNNSQPIIPIQQKGCNRRVVLLGDALHAMSPFKGQGANQALQDGPLLADWLGKSKFHPALVGFDREVRQRTHKTVVASREAALHLHSSSVLLKGEEDFVGVAREHIPTLLEELKQRNIGAHLGKEGLEDAIAKVIQELNIDGSTSASGDNSIKKKKQNKYKPLNTEAAESMLQAAATGVLPVLRNSSKTYDPDCFSTMTTNDKGETCLHLAARNGHLATCQWLLSECDVPCDVKDHSGNTPSDAAIMMRSNDDEIYEESRVSLLLRRYREFLQKRNLRT
jgi:2-polyprenyl-6-methoxyphenol hydroxylase-like FAD-dependent oxidoreductase